MPIGVRNLSLRSFELQYLIGVALVSVSLMALEIGLTRIFSCMIWYHLSFLTISLTMLGFSLGGLVLLLFPSLKGS